MKKKIIKMDDSSDKSSFSGTIKTPVFNNLTRSERVTNAKKTKLEDSPMSSSSSSSDIDQIEER